MSIVHLEGLRQQHGAADAHAVRGQVEALERGVVLERVSEQHGTLGARTVAAQLELEQRRVRLERLRQQTCCIA